MKKLLILLVMLVLVSSFALAEVKNTQPELVKADMLKTAAVPTLLTAKGEGNGSGNGTLIQEQMKDHVLTKLQNGSAEGLMLKGEAGAKLQAGLTNALTQVKNEKARAVLEQNLNKFTEKYQNRLANMTDVEVEVDNKTGAAMVKAKEKAKFLGLFKAQKTKKFEISANGEIKEKKSAFGFLYAKAKTELVE